MDVKEKAVIANAARDNIDSCLSVINELTPAQVKTVGAIESIKDNIDIMTAAINSMEFPKTTINAVKTTVPRKKPGPKPKTTSKKK